MTRADGNDSAAGPQALPSAEAGFVGPPQRPRYVCLHHPQAPAHAAAMIIVPPFGYEAVCARRALRHLGEDAARAGLLALRIDPDGTGNSAGGDLDGDRVEAWIASIHDACNLARSRGAQHVVLVGVRLGALLATLAAGERDDVSALVAIAPVTRGKAWLRECRMLQMSLDLEADPSEDAKPSDPDVQEVVGFALSAQTRERLAGVNLDMSTIPPAPRVLVIERSGMPPDQAWPKQLAALGAEVRCEQLPGYAEMVLDPHHAQVPQAIIDATVAFAAGAVPPGSAPRPPVSCELRQRTGLPVADGQVLDEEAVRLDECLAGIATYPHSSIERAVILLNSGAIGTIGPNRLYVELARRLSGSGDLVLRLDLSGIADSPARAGATENTVYSAHAVADVGKAVAWARQAGAREIAVAGLCSGGYHALKAALAGQAIDRIVVINPLTFHYVPGMALDYSPSKVTEDVNRYAESMRSANSWKKLLRGEVDLLRLLRVLAHRARMLLASKLKDALRGLPLNLGEDLGRDLLGLARRGVALRFVFSASDPGLAMLREQGGSAVRRLIGRKQLGIEVINGPDHTFTARWAHEPLLRAVIGALHR